MHGSTHAQIVFPCFSPLMQGASIYATVDFSHVKQQQMIRLVEDTIYDAVEFRSRNRKEEDNDSD